MSEAATPPVGPDGSLIKLHAHHDARDLVRLLQCAVCSHLLRTPVTLPCGNSCCRQCLPEPHRREHISFSRAGRQQGINCPFSDCGAEHALEECSTNVVLYKIMDAVLVDAALYRSKRDVECADWRDISLNEVLKEGHDPTNRMDLDTEHNEKIIEAVPHQHTAKGGRLLATLDFALSGELRFASDVEYGASAPDSADAAREIALDENVLTSLKEATAKEIECNVCYHPMLEPTTTPCGHTFCRKCLARVLDYSSMCPECRRELFLPSSLARQPHNKYLVHIMKSLCPEQVAARAQALAEEETAGPDGLDTALFPCTVGFPGLKTFLHIFEPRYRLMIRRAIESNGQFGMLAYNRHLEEQGDLGRTQFMQVGTMLKIEQFSMLEDGRSVIECKGLYRFRVRAHGLLDGYIVANVEKLNDISLADEEELEAREISALPPAEESAPPSPSANVDRMSTAQLNNVIMSFINNARSSSQRWVRNRLLETYGEPPTEPALLPYWLAAVLPLMDEEKYRMLPTTSARERLKIAARWCIRIESQRW